MAWILNNGLDKCGRETRRVKSQVAQPTATFDPAELVETRLLKSQAHY
jgi:hypothetical protein